jgi:hypothetical protein
VGQHLPSACLNIRAERIISHDTKICFSGFLQAFDEFNIIAYKNWVAGSTLQGFLQVCFFNLTRVMGYGIHAYEQIFNISSTGRKAHCLGLI